MATKYTYASPGVINVTDAAGNVTELKFTSTGQIQGIKDPLNIVTNFTYDDNGNLSQITAPDNITYSFTYDRFNRANSRI